MDNSTPTRSPLKGWRWLFGFILFIGLIVCFYAEENWRGRRAWEKYQTKLAARGIELDWLKLAPPLVADADNFAMTPFLRQAGSRAVVFAPEFNSEKPAPGRELWTDGQMTDLEAAVMLLRGKSNAPAVPVSFASRAEAAAAVLREMEKYEPVLDELRAASGRPEARFDLGYDTPDPWSTRLPHLATLRKLGKVLGVRAAAELAAGNADAALADTELLLRLADSVENEPFFISHLVRLAMLKNAGRIIWEGLADHRWSDRQLSDLQARLGKLNLLRDLDRCLAGDRALENAMCEMLRNDPRHANVLAGFGGQSGQDDRALYLFHAMPDGWLDLEQLSCQRLFDEDVLAGFDVQAGVVHPQLIKDAWTKLAKEHAGGFLHHRLIAGLLQPQLQGTIRSIAFSQACLDEANVACGLERHRLANRQYPDDLSALTPTFSPATPHDVINGAPLKYRRTDDGQFVLYSVGWNETDDGGKVVTNKGIAPRIGIDQSDWVWLPYPVKQASR